MSTWQRCSNGADNGMRLQHHAVVWQQIVWCRRDTRLPSSNYNAAGLNVVWSPPLIAILLFWRRMSDFFPNIRKHSALCLVGILGTIQESRRPTQVCRKKNAMTSALPRYDGWESATAVVVLTVTNTITGLLLLGNRTHKTIGRTQTRMMLCFTCVFLWLWYDGRDDTNIPRLTASGSFTIFYLWYDGRDDTNIPRLTASRSFTSPPKQWYTGYDPSAIDGWTLND